MVGQDATHFPLAEEITVLDGVYLSSDRIAEIWSEGVSPRDALNALRTTVGFIRSRSYDL